MDEHPPLKKPSSKGIVYYKGFSLKVWERGSLRRGGGPGCMQMEEDFNSQRMLTAKKKEDVKGQAAALHRGSTRKSCDEAPPICRSCASLGTHSSRFAGTTVQMLTQNVFFLFFLLVNAELLRYSRERGCTGSNQDK